MNRPFRTRRLALGPPLTIALVGLALTLSAGCGDPAPPDPSEVVVTVDGSPITRGVVDALINAEVARRPRDGVTDRARRGALETLIGMELMYSAARKRGMSVPAERLAEELEGVRSQFAKEEEFAAYLANNGLTEAGLQQRAERRLLVAEYVDEAIGDTVPDEAALREAYEARRDTLMEPEAFLVRQVMARLKRKGDPLENDRVAREAAEQAREQLLAGESWDTVTPKFSTGPNALKGGLMEWFSRGRWMPAFEAVVVDTPVGELSEVFRTPMAYHVLTVVERREARPLTFEAVRNSLSLQLTRELRDSAREAHIRELMEAAEIEILDDELRAAMEGED